VDVVVDVVELLSRTSENVASSVRSDMQVVYWIT
jgi:hypothetical protein